MMIAKEILQEQEGRIVAVRTPGEFLDGHAAGVLNIPLHALQQHLDGFTA